METMIWFIILVVIPMLVIIGGVSAGRDVERHLREERDDRKARHNAGKRGR